MTNAYFVGAMRAMATLAKAMGNDLEATRLAKQANATADAMRSLLFDAAGSGLFVDTTNTSHSAWHASVFPLWFGITPAGAGTAKALSFLRERRMVGSVYAAYGEQAHCDCDCGCGCDGRHGGCLPRTLPPAHTVCPAPCRLCHLCRLSPCPAPRCRPSHCQATCLRSTPRMTTTAPRRST